MQRNFRTRSGDLAVLILVALLTATYCYVYTRHRLLWSDELFGWLLVSDPSWAHMLRAWNLGADGGGIAFYTLCRLWLGVFGRHVLAFRFFSATGVYVGFTATWFALRRFYRPGLCAMVLPLVWFSGPILLWHILQTRFYGLLLSMTACTLLVSLRSARDADTGRPADRNTLITVFLVNVLLVGTHPFGFAYSGLLLVSALLCDFAARRRRPLYYVSVVLSWSVLAFSVNALRNSARVGKPWFWTTVPTLRELFYSYHPDYFPVLQKVALLLLLIVLASMLWKHRREAILQGFIARRDILIPGVLLFATPVYFWVLSQHGTSYFVDRYFCPFTIGIAVLGTELLTHIFVRPFSRATPIPLLFAVSLSCIAFYNVVFRCMLPYARNLGYPPLQNWTLPLAALLPRNEPIVMQRADIFDLMIYYHGAPDLQMYSPLDWQVALSPESPRWLVSATHEMENWKFAGYYPDNIVYSDQFLRTHSHFVVVEDEITPWFHDRIATQPGWHLRKLGRYENGAWTSNIWDVTRDERPPS